MKNANSSAIDYFRYIDPENDNYFKIFDIVNEKGDRLEFAGDSNRAKGTSIKYKILDGIYIYKTNCIYYDVDWRGVKTYIDDALVIYKLISGKLKITLSNGRQLILCQGDILNVSGNYNISTFYSFGQRIELIGVMCFYQKMLESVKQMEWDNSLLEEFYNDKNVQNGIVYRGDLKIGELIDVLDAAICDNNKLLIKAKALELLSTSALNYKNYAGKKTLKCSKTQLTIAEEVKAFLDNHLDTYYTMPHLAKKFTISLSGLKTAFKELCGTSPYQYHIDRRLEKAKELLEKSDLKIANIYAKTGFSCHSNFVNAFKKKYHCYPSHYRKNKTL